MKMDHGGLGYKCNIPQCITIIQESTIPVQVHGMDQTELEYLSGVIGSRMDTPAADDATEKVFFFLGYIGVSESV